MTKTMSFVVTIVLWLGRNNVLNMSTITIHGQQTQQQQID